MPKEVTVPFTRLRREFRRHLRMVEAGTVIVITKRGVAVGVLVPESMYRDFQCLVSRPSWLELKSKITKKTICQEIIGKSEMMETEKLLNMASVFTVYENEQ